MAERERKHIGLELLKMKISREELLFMIRLNCKCAPDMAGNKTLLNICADGMTFGAMESICPDCKMILHEDGDRYRCLAGMSMQTYCDYDQYVVNTASTPWIIPQSVESRELKEWKRRFENFEAKSFLNRVMTEQRKGVIKDINGHNKLANGMVIVRDAQTLYNYFLVPRLDLTGKASHVLGQVQEDLKKLSCLNRYCFYKKEKIFKRGADHSYDNLTLEAAISEFKSQFLNSSGINWVDRLVEEQPTRKKSRMLPLKIDYDSTLEYEKAKGVDDLHKQMVVTLDYLMKFEIDREQIKEEFIKRAQNITVQHIQYAHQTFKFIERIKETGLDISSMPMDDLTRLLTDKKDQDLKLLSIIARLITLPGGTTLRLVDIQKTESFNQIQKILGVFYEESWPSSVAEITHEYMMHKTLNTIGGWIMNLVFSSDEVHHHYIVQKHTCCYWSVLLRKAEKALAEDSFDPLILCTMDFEMVASDKKEGTPMMDKQMSTKRVSLSKVDAIDYDNYGYLVHHDNKDRVKLQMVFPVKYCKRRKGPVREPNDGERAEWIDFIRKFYSGDSMNANLKKAAKKIFKETRSPYIYCGETWKSKIEKTLK